LGKEFIIAGAKVMLREQGEKEGKRKKVREWAKSHNRNVAQG